MDIDIANDFDFIVILVVDDGLGLDGLASALGLNERARDKKSVKKLNERKWKDWTNLGFDISESSGNVGCTALLGFGSVTNLLDLLAEVADEVKTRRISDRRVRVVQIVVFLTNDEYWLSHAVVGKDGRIAATDKQVLGK